MEVRSRAELRAWLLRNHGQAESIWLVSFKKEAGDLYLPYEAIVEEALCFGWIDSRPRVLDGQRSMRLLSPRKPGSAWSSANRERAEDLIRRGLMHRSGLAKIEAARRDGSWEFLKDVQDGTIPTDLREAFHANATAWRNFKAFPPSSKRIILEWIKNAKRPETRAKRVAETVAKAALNLRANHYRQ